MWYFWFVAGCIFLCNPLINVVDFLPDCIGYFCLMIGLTEMSYADVRMAACRKKIWILLLISLPKVMLGFFSLRPGVFPILGESTMVLCYAFVYAFLDCYFMWTAADCFFDGLLRIGVDSGSSEGAVLYRIKKGKKIPVLDNTRRLTHWFVVLRALASVLPQMIFLADVTYLEYDIYGVFMDVRDAFPVLMAATVLLMLPFSIVWCVKMCRYLHAVKKDGRFDRNLSAKEQELGEHLVLSRQHSTLRDGFALLLLGAIFFFPLSIDDINYLPPFVGILLILLGMYLLRRYLKITKKVLILGGILVPCSIFSYVFSGICARNYFSGIWSPDLLAEWFRGAKALAKTDLVSCLRYCGLDLVQDDRVAWDMQLLSFLATSVVCVLLLLFLLELLRMLEQYWTHGGEALLHRYCVEARQNENEAQKRLHLLLSACRCVVVFFMVFTALGEFPFFVYFRTLIPTFCLISGLLFLLLFADYLKQTHSASME